MLYTHPTPARSGPRPSPAAHACTMPWQPNNSDVPRESIFELVHSLRDTVVPSNLPSQLRQRGMGGQQRGDVSSAHARFQDDFHHRGRAADKAAAERGAANRRNSSRYGAGGFTAIGRGCGTYCGDVLCCLVECTCYACLSRFAYSCRRRYFQPEKSSLVWFRLPF